MTKVKTDRSTRGVAPCYICLSPYRREVEKLLDNGLSISKVSLKYSPIFAVKKETLARYLARHKNGNHKEVVKKQVWGAQAIYNKNAPSMDADLKEAITFEVAAEQLLKIGMVGAEDLAPKEALRLAAQLQRTHLEGKKVTVSENALKLTAAKFFGGFLGGGDPTKVEERNDSSTPGIPDSVESEN